MHICTFVTNSSQIDKRIAHFPYFLHVLIMYSTKFFTDIVVMLIATYNHFSPTNSLIERIFIHCHKIKKRIFVWMSTQHCFLMS